MFCGYDPRGFKLFVWVLSAANMPTTAPIGHKFLNADVYFIDYLPSQLQAQDVLMGKGQCAGGIIPRLPMGHFLRQPQKRRWQTRAFAFLEAVQVLMDNRRILQRQHP